MWHRQRVITCGSWNPGPLFSRVRPNERGHGRGDEGGPRGRQAHVLVPLVWDHRTVVLPPVPHRDPKGTLLESAGRTAVRHTDVLQPGVPRSLLREVQRIAGALG